MPTMITMETVSGSTYEFKRESAGEANFQVRRVNRETERHNDGEWEPLWALHYGDRATTYTGDSEQSLYGILLADMAMDRGAMLRLPAMDPDNPYRIRVTSRITEVSTDIAEAPEK